MSSSKKKKIGTIPGNGISSPCTAIVIGSGCSANLGVPTMAGFMDRVFSVLSAEKGTEEALKRIREFIQKVRGSAAYVRTDLLNIEELYGLAELDEMFTSPKMVKEKTGANNSGNEPPTVKESFNQAIFKVTENAGLEMINDFKRFHGVIRALNEIKRESHNEEIGGATSVNRYTNLLAYLCLADFKEARNSDAGDRDLHPLFIQFNWDLALDRALWCHGFKDCEQPKIPAPETPDSEYMRWLSLDEGAYGDFDFTAAPLVLRPHGAINWIEEKRDLAPRRSRHPNESDADDRDLSEKMGEFGFVSKKNYFNPGGNKPRVLSGIIDNHRISDAGCRNYDGEYMRIAPPTWKKDPEQFLGQWQAMRKFLANVRRIIFIGYSMPKSDLYFRHFLALALSENNYAPKVYVWNPGISKLGPVRESYTDLFAPLAREGRLYGIDGYFGDPALYDLNRVFHIAKRIDSSAG